MYTNYRRLKSSPFYWIMMCLLFSKGIYGASKNLEEKSVVSYTFQRAKSNSLLVTLEFKGNKSGKTEIMYANEWAGNVFHDDITDFKIQNKNSVLNSTIEKNVKLINHMPNELLKITYKVTQNVATADRTYRALISENYFHFIGQSALVTPAVDDDNKVFKFRMRFKGFEKSFKFANSFFALKSSYFFEASVAQLLHSVYTGGDFRIKKINIKNKPLYVAILGEWNFKDKDLFNVVQNIVSYQRQFFNDHDFDHFLITVIPNGKECCSSGGTGLTNSFATYLPKDAKLHTQIKLLLAHELFHTWNGGRIRRQEPEQLLYWFSEGFTDYYTRLLLLRAGEISIKEYIDEYNKALYAYFTSEFINEPNSRILKDFWINDDIQKLPYRRGHILAHKWSNEIKKKTDQKKSLDNILIDLFLESKNKDIVLSHEAFQRISSSYLRDGFFKDLDLYITQGKTIIPGEEDLGPCVKRAEVSTSKFDYGYDSNLSNSRKTITGLDKNSSAYKAGLRDGDVILSRKLIYPPYKKSTLKVKDTNGNVKVINYFPLKNQKIKAYFYVLDEYMFNTNPKQCLSYFDY